MLSYSRISPARLVFLLLSGAVLGLWAGKAHGQCPLIENSAITPACNACPVCPNTTFTFEIGGIDLPNGGKIDWYAGKVPNFDPRIPGAGVLLGSSAITNPPPDQCAPCPEILAIFLDACNGGGQESDNEFIVIGSGVGFNSDQLGIDINNNGDPANNDIQLGANPCGLQMPSPTLMANIQNDAGCNGGNVHFAGPNTEIPAEAVVLVFTSAGENYDYDFSSLCATGQTIYVLQSACTRVMNIGAFTNVTSSGLRSYHISLGNCPACTSTITYDTDNPGLSGDGDFVYLDVNQVVQYENSGCNAPPVDNIVLPPVSSIVEPFSFTFDESFCADVYGGPVYVVGIMNPSPQAPCPDLFSSYYHFTMYCPDAQAANNGPLCAGDTLQLFAGALAGAEYSWSGPNGFNSAEQNPVVANAASNGTGTYTLQISQYGCEDAASTEVVILPQPTAGLSGPAMICQGEVANLSIAFTGTGPFTFTYALNGLPQPAITSSDNPYVLPLSPDEDALISLIEIHNGQCQGLSSGTVDLTVHPAPEIRIDRTLCFGDSILVNGKVYNEANPSGEEILQTAAGCDSILRIQLAFGNAAIYQYSGSICPGDTVILGEMVFDAAHSQGEILLPMGASAGCDSLIRVDLQIKDAGALSFAPPTCPGDEDGRLQLTGPDLNTSSDLLVNGILYPFTQLPFEVGGLAPGDYVVSLPKDADLCLAERLVVIPELPPYTLEIKVDSTQSLLDLYTLSFESNMQSPQISWSPAEALSCSDCPSPVAEILFTTVYDLTLESAEGCLVSGSREIRVLSNQQVFVPNGFSPNGDGVNDFFTILGKKKAIREIRSMRIFNRWGDEVFGKNHFAGNEETLGWDGNFRGKPMEAGVYVYLIEVTLVSGENRLISGDLSLLR